MSRSTHPSNSPPTLSEAQLDELETLLWERAVPQGGMSLEMLDGYFSALITGPELVKSSEYLSAVWGDPPPVWDNVAEGANAFHLVQGYWNHVVDRLGHDPQAHPEVVVPPMAMSEGLHAHIQSILDTGEIPEALELEETEQDPLPYGSPWAIGFYYGVELREEAWMDRAEQHEHIGQHLDDLYRLLPPPPSDEDDQEQDEDEPYEPLRLAERLDIVFEVPHILHAFNVLRLSEQIRAQGPAQRDDVPGRNDLCPCGSGRKFKKCCGDPARLN